MSSSHHDTARPPHSRLFVVCGRGVSESELERLFSAFGVLQSVRCLHDKGVAYVKFALASAAALAIESVALFGDAEADANTCIKDDRARDDHDHAHDHDHATNADADDATHTTAERGGGGGGGSSVVSGGGGDKDKQEGDGGPARRSKGKGDGASCRTFIGGCERELRVMLAEDHQSGGRSGGDGGW